MMKAAVAGLTFLVVALAVALVFVATTSSADRDSQSKRLSERASKLDTFQRQLRRAQLEATKPTGDPAQIVKLRKRVKQLEDCVPEVQNEISSLTLDRESLFISSSSQVSRVCSPTVYGSPLSGD